MSREVNRTRRFFGYAADMIASIAEADTMDVLSVLYAADFVGFGGEGALGGESRGTKRALPCQGVLGSGRWHARDGAHWWSVLVEAIRQQDMALPPLRPSVVTSVAETRLVEPEAIWALTFRLFTHAEKVRMREERLDGYQSFKGGTTLQPAGFRGERLLDFFRVEHDFAGWVKLQGKADEIVDDELRQFAAHPADTSKYGVMPFGRIWWVDRAAGVVRNISGGQDEPAWVVSSYQAPHEHSKFRWEQK